MIILARIVLVCRVHKIRSSKSGVSPINILSAVYALYVKGISDGDVQYSDAILYDRKREVRSNIFVLASKLSMFQIDFTR